MTAISVSAPFPILTDIDGSPLDAGYVYIGQANLDPVAFPKSAYWDASLTTPAAQPIRTTGGYPVRNGSPARIYTDGDYSIRINNKNGTLVYSSPASTDRLDSWQIGYNGGTVRDVLDAVTGPSGAASVGYMPAGTGAVATNVQSKLREAVSVFDYMDKDQIADVESGNASVDVTLAIQNAINNNRFVYFPEGVYRTSATLTLSDYQTVVGAGSSVSVIKNDVSDVFSKGLSTKTDGNYITVRGIGCTKTFNKDSRTIAFNLTNVSFSTFEDIAATNFYGVVYMYRDAVGTHTGDTGAYGGTGECWYNHFRGITATECAYAVWINGGSPYYSVNGCTFDGVTHANWSYLWAANGVTPTWSIRYDGYGHAFRDSYLQGSKYKVWRDAAGAGDNLISGIYMESDIGGGAYAVYAPTFVAGGKDTIITTHGDGLDATPYDPSGKCFDNNQSVGLSRFDLAGTGSIAASSTKTVTVTCAAGNVCSLKFAISAGGNGAGAISLDAQGLLSNANYYSISESNKFSYINITVNSATKGNGSFSFTVANAHTVAAAIKWFGYADSYATVVIS